MALVSLMAQEQKQPLYKFFGAKNIGSLKTDITISLNTIDRMLEDTRSAISNGMEILKVKLAKDINHAIATTTAIVSEHKNIKIIVDANQAWSLQDTLLFTDALKDMKIELIEQPVGANDLESLKIITSKTDIPIVADEAAFTLEDVKYIVDTKSADMINIKLMKCGGVTKAIEILEYARQNSIKCMLGSMLEGPISINVALHLAMAYGDVIEYLDLDSPLLYKTPSNELEFDFDGCNIKYRGQK